MQIFDPPDPIKEGEGHGLPGVVLIISTVLAGLRFYAFHVIDANRTHDALWQFAYSPLWVLDFPITIGYFITPIPFGEAIVGPVWWFSLPILIWKWLQRRKRIKKASPVCDSK